MNTTESKKEQENDPNFTTNINYVEDNLKFLKDLKQEYHIMNNNREALIETLKTINNNIRKCNQSKLSNQHLSDILRKNGITGSKEKIVDSINFLEKIRNEIINIKRKIDELKCTNSVFEGSAENKKKQIKSLENDKSKLKEELFNFILLLMDQSYEYQTNSTELEEENKELKKKINNLLSIVNEIKDENQSLLDENTNLKNKIDKPICTETLRTNTHSGHSASNSPHQEEKADILESTCTLDVII
uniref:Uncharacterized protein n=2 Tax=Clastoptera arizonana TaxID=38151 RepID=A0A1B6CCX7_9HEMI